MTQTAGPGDPRWWAPAATQPLPPAASRAAALDGLTSVTPAVQRPAAAGAAASVRGNRPILPVSDARLRYALTEQGGRSATLSEYAEISGLSTNDVVTGLAELLERDVVQLEIVQDEIFVHTAPYGRPAPGGHPDLPPNLWEQLRRAVNADWAYLLWKLIRALERSGWRVRTETALAASRSGPAMAPLSLLTTTGVVPLVPFPSMQSITAPDGALARLAQRGVRRVAVSCSSGHLDSTTTAVRVFLSRNPAGHAMDVVILEAPRYDPVVLSGADGAVAARSISRHVDNPTTWVDSSPRAGSGVRTAPVAS